MGLLIRVPAGLRGGANATVRPAEALHGWLGRSAPLMEQCKQVASRRVRFAALGDGAGWVAPEAQARRWLEMLVQTAARRCRLQTANSSAQSERSAREDAEKQSERSWWSQDACKSAGGARRAVLGDLRSCWSRRGRREMGGLTRQRSACERRASV